MSSRPSGRTSSMFPRVSGLGLERKRGCLRMGRIWTSLLLLLLPLLHRLIRTNGWAPAAGWIAVTALAL